MAATSLAALLRRQPRESKPSYRDRLWLLGAILGKTEGALFLDEDRNLSAIEWRRYQRALLARKKGIPLQHIVERANFWGRDFFVNSSVLIPRPETERLVELALEHFGSKGVACTILDVGTGSGAIAVTLALECPAWKIAASDISSAALRVAQKNAYTLGAAVDFFRASLLAPPIRLEHYDWIISNPPYLEFRRDYISREVQQHEPRLALEPSANLRVGKLTERAAWAAERILRGCEKASRPPKGTLLELSPRIALFLERRWRNNERVAKIERIADLAGRRRFLLVAWKREEIGHG